MASVMREEAMSSTRLLITLWVVYLGGLPVLTTQSTVKNANFKFCETSHVTTGGVGSKGNITSAGYPDSMPPRGWNERMCEMTLTSCPECRITLTLLEFTMPECNEEPHFGSCIYGCDHLLVYESSYPAVTTRYFKSGQQGEAYVGDTRRLNIKYCHYNENNDKYRRFVLQYNVYEKVKTFAKSTPYKGNFTSPYFPMGFHSRQHSLSNEVFTYHLINTKPLGRIKLWFDDWSFPAHSLLKIYNGPSTSSRSLGSFSGRNKRPFLFSESSDLLIQLHTGSVQDGDYSNIPDVGFLARFEFVDDTVWRDKPLLDCGENLHSLLGGNFGFNKSAEKCIPGSYVDCLWLVWKYKYMAIMLYFKDVNWVDGDLIEVRYGNNSLAPLEAFEATLGEFVTSGNAFYVRYKARCTTERHFKAIFASFMTSDLFGCEDSARMLSCQNGRCISQSLICDGMDHCHDGFHSDEMYCPDPAPRPTPPVCATQYYRCHNTNAWYCGESRCDFIFDCEDGTDEEGCNLTTPAYKVETSPPDIFSAYHWGTIIPIVLICIVLAVIACIIVSYYTRRKQRARQRRRTLGQDSAAASTNQASSVPGPTFRYPDAPPTYEESMMSPPSAGIFNMAYSRTDSMDHLGQPPPYTPAVGGSVEMPYEAIAPRTGSVVIGNQPVANPLYSLATAPPQMFVGGQQRGSVQPLPSNQGTTSAIATGSSPGVHSYGNNNAALIHGINQIQDILNGKHCTSENHRSVQPGSQNPDQARESSSGPIREPQTGSSQGHIQGQAPQVQGQVSMSGQGALGDQILPIAGTNIEMRELSNETPVPTTRNIPSCNSSQSSSTPNTQHGPGPSSKTSENENTKTPVEKSTTSGASVNPEEKTLPVIPGNHGNQENKQLGDYSDSSFEIECATDAQHPKSQQQTATTNKQQQSTATTTKEEPTNETSSTERSQDEQNGVSFEESSASFV